MKPGKKPKKGKSPPPKSAAGWRAAVRPLLGAAITIAITVGVLSALGWLGDEARQRIADRERYSAKFAAYRTSVRNSARPNPAGASHEMSANLAL